MIFLFEQAERERKTYTADYVIVVCEVGLAFSAAEYLVGVEVDVVCEAHVDVWLSVDLASTFVRFRISILLKLIARNRKAVKKNRVLK